MDVKDLTSRLPLPSTQRARGPVVAAVKLHGVITPTPAPLGRGVINLAVLESVLTRAFGYDRLRAVVLLINSPGGSPTQSALVADRIRGLADQKHVPVLAFCEDVAASGGYWLACAADEIVAHPTSLVGSIGVVSQGFGLHGLLERFGIERRLHTAGTNKARLDPFLPEREDDVEWLRGMQTELHGMFRDWVCSRRGDRLATGQQDLFTGEVWSGRRALELGLVDRLGTMRGEIAKRYPDAEIINVDARRPLLARLGLGPVASLSGRGGPESALAVLEALEHRAAWSRFGL
ncbi:MAG: S49 family peptidase [Pseudonocardiales bacterium]|nr:S49 family peptidase [Pseudonocardiales bacterium]PZS28756.1 MAG: S49 family peptidase [Pseudonocardiales bacterium]